MKIFERSRRKSVGHIALGILGILMAVPLGFVIFLSVGGLAGKAKPDLSALLLLGFGIAGIVYFAVRRQKADASSLSDLVGSSDPTGPPEASTLRRAPEDGSGVRAGSRP